MKPSAARGFSLVELTVVLVIIGVISMMAVPRFGAAVETTNVDRGSATLHSLWLAERMYRLEKGEFTPSLSDLHEMKLIRESVFENDQDFRYRIISARADGVVLRARRDRSTGWSGEIGLDEKGALSGEVARGGDVVLP